MPTPAIQEVFVAVTGASGAVAAGGYGFTSVVRNGAGDYTITLAKELDTNEGLFVVTIKTAQSQYRVVQTSDSAKQVLIFTGAGAAGDADFNFAAFRCVP